MLNYTPVEVEAAAVVEVFEFVDDITGDSEPDGVEEEVEAEDAEEDSEAVVGVDDDPEAAAGFAGAFFG